MRRLQLGRRGSGLRARRWDAIVLGSALPGLVAAIRLGQRGHRVLVVEEEAAARRPGPMRDPFALGPQGSAGFLDACLAALKIGLRDRRRIEPEPVAHQVVLPSARIDVGDPVHTARELVSWGLAKPGEARDWTEALAHGAERVRSTLGELPLARRGGLRGLARTRPGAPHAAGLEEARELLEHASPALTQFADLQLRALSHAAGGAQQPTAHIRVLGGVLLGTGSFADATVTLRRLLQRRIQELHGELRTVRGFEFVSVDPYPGIAQPATREVWLGRALVLNAPRGLLAAALREDECEVPAFLEAPAPARRRLLLDLRCDPGVIPEGMARRVILPLGGAADGPLLTLACWPGAAAHDAAHLVARLELDARSPGDEEVQAQIADAIGRLMPFSSGRVLVREHTAPRWDDEDAQLAPTDAWPPDANVRLGSRRPVFGLPREDVAALGTEGDVLLGWKGGDAIAEELG